ncbi:MAG: MFS transporter [Rickettsiaceae bacterium]
MSLWKVFSNYKLFEIFVLGIISGMPMSILIVALSAWLYESNIAVSVITTFAVAKIPFAFKPLWAPVVDNTSIPYLSRFGQRKSWMMICLLINITILFTISSLNPSEHLAQLYYWTILLGISAATFDINADAFRIERFDNHKQSLAAASMVFGYRIGMLMAGAGSLYFSELTSWGGNFQMLSLIFAMGLVFVYFLNEEKIFRSLDGISISSFKIIILEPFLEFFHKNRSIIIILGVFSFKIGDVMLGSVANVFYLKLGFSKSEIASITKLWGLCATIVGSYIGGVIIYKIGNLNGLIVTGLIQSVTNLGFLWLNYHPGDLYALTISITLENIGNGMGTVALVGYISYLCNKRYSATQYALFSSCSTFANDTVSIYTGHLVELIGWEIFLLSTAFFGLPSIMLFVYLRFYFLNSGINKPVIIQK